MTFVLNLLHKDFSLLAADRQGNVDGPATITVGNMTVHVTGGKTTINGLKKIAISDNKTCALGIAGNSNEHRYIEQFKSSETPLHAMKQIRNAMEAFFDFDARDELLAGTPQMENQTLLTFFDNEKSAFFTNMSLFTKFANTTNLYARRANSSPILCHIGSGSSHFEAAVGLDEINAFIARVAVGADVEDLITWFKSTFEKVSALAPDCSPDFDAVLSTREKPNFESVYGRKYSHAS